MHIWQHLSITARSSISKFPSQHQQVQRSKKFTSRLSHSSSKLTWQHQHVPLTAPATLTKSISMFLELQSAFTSMPILSRSSRSITTFTWQHHHVYPTATPSDSILLAWLTRLRLQARGQAGNLGVGWGVGGSQPVIFHLIFSPFLFLSIFTVFSIFFYGVFLLRCCGEREHLMTCHTGLCVVETWSVVLLFWMREKKKK